MNNQDYQPDDFDRLINDDELLARAFAEATRQALLENKRAGNSIAVWRDGQVVLIPPELIDPDAVAADE
jgi:hypothetical protein